MFTSSPRSRSRGRRRQLGIVVALLLSGGLVACSAAEPADDPSEESETVPAMRTSDDLAAGTYRVEAFSVPFEVTVPEGWSYRYDADLLEGQDVFLKFDNAAYAPLDACRWTTPLVEVGPSVSDMAGALAAAASTTTSAPIDVEVSGYEGVEFDLAIENGVEMAECRESHVCIHSEAVGHCTRYYHEGVGQRETYRILDLDGERALLTVGQWAENADPKMIEEARAVFDSITFVSD